MNAPALTLTITGAFALGAVFGAALTLKPAPAPARIQPPQPGCKPAMQIPVDFDVAILQSGPGISDPVWRYYKAEPR